MRTEPYTPTWFEVRQEAQHVTRWTTDELDRMIDQVRAEALRDAREALIADQTNLYGIVPPDVNGAVDLLEERADRIEKGAIR